jgi:Mn2+/Fe2+ NRAMP family transporter
MAGAAFLMATSAIGPGFLTQTAAFTGELRSDFGFAILWSVLLALAVQLNVWLVLGASSRRAPELASAVLPGSGVVLVVLVVLGGLVFNVGNVAGCGLGLSVLGLPPRAGAAASALAVTVLLASRRAGTAMDRLTRLLGAAMILITAWVMVRAAPDYLGALGAALVPGRVEVLPVVTLLGGTVGGYIPFSGVHRLLDGGVGGPRDVSRLTRSASLGVAVTAVMRVLFFLAVLGVVGRGAGLDPTNPPASAFRLGAGEWGYLFFGVVLWSAAVTSTVGCTYTSLSFVESALPAWRTYRPVTVLAFVASSLALFLILGRPVRLLILAGALNGLILPFTLLIVLLAAHRPQLLGGYRHPRGLVIAGWAAWAAAAVAAALSLGDMARLWS